MKKMYFNYLECKFMFWLYRKMMKLMEDKPLLQFKYYKSVEDVFKKQGYKSTVHMLECLMHCGYDKLEGLGVRWMGYDVVLLANIFNKTSIKKEEAE